MHETCGSTGSPKHREPPQQERSELRVARVQATAEFRSNVSSLALKQPPKRLPDSDTFCGYHGRNISTYRESLVPGIPTLVRRCIMHAYESACSRSRAYPDMAATSGRNVAVSWEYLDVRERKQETKEREREGNLKRSRKESWSSTPGKLIGRSITLGT